MIESIVKAVKILDALSENGGSVALPLGRIAELTGLHASTCAHILATLCACDYLEKVSRREGYVLGPKAYMLTANRPYRMGLLRIAIPLMLDLCNNLRENVSLSAYHNGSLYVAYSAFYEEDNIRRKGTLRGMLYSSAAGRVIIANMHTSEREMLFKQRGYPKESEWPAARSARDLEKELSMIRQDGYCAAHEVVTGLSAVSCPLWVAGSAVREAMGAYMPAERFCGEHRERAIDEVQLTAYLISRKIAASARA